jgi:RNA polymerase sigma factor (sigma-70 family)
MKKLHTHTTDTFTTNDGLIIRYQDMFDGAADYLQVFATTRGSRMSDEDIEDIYQTACLKIVKYHESYKPQLASPKTFGSRIAENCAKDALKAYIRKRSAFSALEREDEDGKSYEPKILAWYRGNEFEADADVRMNELVSFIKEKMGTLNVNYQTILDLASQDLTPKKMAEEIGCTPGAAATLLCRARKALVKAFGEEFASEYGLCA